MQIQGISLLIFPLLPFFFVRTLEESKYKAIEKKQELLSTAISLRERELRELLFLESGGNILDFDEHSPSILSALDDYHESHNIVSKEKDKKVPQNGETFGEVTPSVLDGE